MKKLNSENDNFLVSFKGGKITRIESKRAMLALGFGVIGVAFTFWGNGRDPDLIGKCIVVGFAVAGYLVGVRSFENLSTGEMSH